MSDHDPTTLDLSLNRKRPPASGVSYSLKRIAWLYGCAKKGSADERAAEALLLAKVDEVRRSEVEP
jgi:hypothetical protein